MKTGSISSTPGARSRCAGPVREPSPSSPPRAFLRCSFLFPGRRAIIRRGTRAHSKRTVPRWSCPTPNATPRASTRSSVSCSPTGIVWARWATRPGPWPDPTRPSASPTSSKRLRMADSPFDLDAPRTVHIVAIGGAGMSAIARYLHALGHRVTGSDQRHSNLLDTLAGEGIATFVGHRADQVPADCDAIAISTAVRDTNPEVVEARRRAIPVLSRADALALVGATVPSVTYGFGPAARYRATSYRASADGAAFDLALDGEALATISLRIRGRHNALNAAGAAALALELGVPVAAVVEGLGTFRGMARRFEYRGTLNGADLYDDYAHTASEVVATLALAREGASGRLVAVYQPHRYTRISRHWREFADAFVDADVVVV